MKINRSLTGYRIKDKMTPWLFLAPGIIFTILLRYIPIGQSLYYSLFDYSFTNPPGEFVGLENFKSILFRDSMFTQSWWNTFVFLFLTLVMTFLIPIIQAIFLSETIRARSVFSAIYLIPAMIPGTIYIVLWKWIWNPQYGLANAILQFFNVPQQTWLSDPGLVKFCITFPGVIGGGFMVLYYLTAILSVNPEIYEASEIDGCVGFKKIWYITLPNITFLIGINLILSIIGVMQSFDAPYQYTKGGPAGSAFTVGIYIYDQYFNYMKIGKSSAASVLLFIVIMILTIIQRRMSNSMEGK